MTLLGWAYRCGLAGGLVGLALGWLRAGAVVGYRVELAAAELGEGILVGLLGGTVVATVGWLLERALSRWVDPSRSRRLAALIGVSPCLAVAGLALNRALGIRPSSLLTAHALPPNGALLLGAFLVALWIGRPGTPNPGRAQSFLVVAVAVAIAGIGGRSALYRSGLEKPRPDVLVVLIDALRADHVGAYGYGRDTTPTLDRLAREGVRFENAIAPSTFTKSSIASLFTGRYPFEHGVYWGAWEDSEGGLHADLLPGSETTMAEVLAAHGYLTEAWVQNSHLQSVFGFDQGFARYRDQQGSVARINRLFRRFLRGPGRRYPYFAYLHYIDLHDPYRPPKEYREMFGDPGEPYAGIELDHWGRHLSAVRRGEVALDEATLDGYRRLYDAQLRAIDDQLAELVGWLEKEDRYQDTLILVTADHGDAFGEHGVISHSSAPYEELVRVPWILKLPRGRFAGHVISEQVSLVDVLPTLLDAVGVSDSPTVSGCSRWPEVRGHVGARDGCEIAVSEIAEEEGEDPTLGLRTAALKYLRFHDGREELYDLESDPLETRNLAGPGGASGNALADFRSRAELIAEQRAEERDRVEVDAATLEALRALGYAN